MTHAARFLIGIILIVGSVMLYRNPAEGMFGIVSVKIAESATTAAFLVAVAVAVQFTVGARILFSGDHWSFVAGAVLIAAFSCYLLLLWRLPSPPRCGCGSFGFLTLDARREILFGLIRNAAICAIASWSALNLLSIDKSRDHNP